MENLIKITTIHNEEIIALVKHYEYEMVKKNKSNILHTSKGCIPVNEIKEIAIIN